MNYKLDLETTEEKPSFLNSAKALGSYISSERLSVFGSLVFLVINSLVSVVTPFFIGDLTNKYIPTGDKTNLLKAVGLLFLLFVGGAIASYFQIYIMGRVGQNVLYKVRNAIFTKLQSLPLQFFNENKSGDLISRVNNDTEKLNQALSETLLRFLGDIFVIVGIGIAMLILNFKLGLIALAGITFIIIITWISSSWIKSKNEKSLQRLGEMSGEIQESLANFKVIVAFNRRDYFNESFQRVNEKNRIAATFAGVANNLLQPIYTYTGAIASVFIIIIGVQILIIDPISAGLIPQFGTLIAFLIYADSFFSPIKEMATLYSSIQTASAAWTRVSSLLNLETNLPIIESEEYKLGNNILLKLENVSFGYTKDEKTLDNINIEMEKGKTYALVGPTGGGKTTTASLMARLYDVSEGRIILNNRDIRSYSNNELSQLIGFILQEPFLFTGTLSDNIKYGNIGIDKMSNEELEIRLKELGLEKILERFSQRLETHISNNADNISLGQKQLIAFLRILLRQPKLLILDEATANIDTVTEELLEDIISKLPKETTKIIIAHRLNTIENADQIFFISSGKIEKPVDFRSALELIKNSKGKS